VGLEAQTVGSSAGHQAALGLNKFGGAGAHAETALFEGACRPQGQALRPGGNGTLLSLVLRGNLVDDALDASALLGNQSLTALDLGYNRLGDGGAYQVAPRPFQHTLTAGQPGGTSSLPTHTNGGAYKVALLLAGAQLECLRLDWNSIGAHGADALARCVTPTTL
jgi:hypothetical protein